MSSIVVLLFVGCLINLSQCAPAMDSMSVPASDLMTSTLRSVSTSNDKQEVEPNITISLNCSCIITTPNLSGSKMVIPGLTVNGQSDYRCNAKAFKECGKTCLSKRNEPIFNIESRSVGVNITNGVNLEDYLCGLMGKGDLATMVSVTTQMDCTEKSETFELFNSQSHSISMSPSLDCPTTTTPIPSTIE